MEPRVTAHNTTCIGTELSPAPDFYRPLGLGQTRVICLQPGEHGSPLKARFEIVQLESARQVRPDLRSWVPELLLDHDDSGKNLRNVRALLSRHEVFCAELSDDCEKVNSTLDELKRLLWQSDAPEPNLRQSSRISFDDQSNSATQVSRPDIIPVPAEHAALTKLPSTLTPSDVQDVFETSNTRDPETYAHLCEIARPFTRLSEAERDCMVRTTARLGAYETLSYAWEDQGFDKRLHMPDCEQDVLITTTVFEALQQLRYRDQERKLWIDALCINQSDPEERSVQISQMSQIYSSAARTIVWLGKSIPSICSAYQVLIAHLSAYTFNLARDEPETGVPFHVAQTLESSSFCPFCSRYLPDSYNKSWRAIEALGALGTMPWFKRLWVVQEVASANFAEVHCGAYRVSWDAFDALFPTFRQLSDVVWDINIAKNLCDEPYSPNLLTWFLMITSKRRCSLAADRVYAIQGITRLPKEALAGTNGDKDHRELFIRLAGYCLTLQCRDALFATKELNLSLPHVALLLALAPQTEPDNCGLPSWVPDWNNVPEDTREMMMEYSSYLSDEFRCGRSFAPYTQKRPLRSLNLVRCLNLMQCHTKDSGKCLSIQGVVVGEVAEILEGTENPYPGSQETRTTPTNHAISHFAEILEARFRHCLAFVEKYWPSEDFEVKLKELLLCISFRWERPDYYDAMISDKVIQNHIELDQALPLTRRAVFEACRSSITDDQGKVDPSKLATWTFGDWYYKVHARRLLGRRLCAIRTRMGDSLLGWLPKTAKIGDCVCLFAGAPRPYILRCHARNDGSFKLLGDSWVHGMCEPEISEFCQSNEAEFEWIELR